MKPFETQDKPSKLEPSLPRSGQASVSLKQEINKLLISVIRPYSKDFKVWDKKAAKRILGKELTINEATEQILKLCSQVCDDVNKELLETLKIRRGLFNDSVLGELESVMEEQRKKKFIQSKGVD